MVNNAAGEPEQIGGTMIDATEHKSQETELAESQVLLNAIINCTSHMIWAVEPNTLGLISFNQTFVDFFHSQVGIQIGLGMRPEDLFPAEGLIKTWCGLYRRAMREGSYTTEYCMPTGRKTLYLNFNLLRREDTIFGISVFAKDITEPRRIVEALRESKEKFQALVESTTDFIWEVNTHGRYTYCSPQIKELWGYEPQEMIGKTPFDQMKPEDREQALEVFRALAETPRPVKGMQVGSVDSSGRDVYVEIGFVPIWDNNQQLVGFRGVSRDITERKRAEDKLRESETRFRTLAENTLVGIFIIRQDRLEYVNPALANMFGYEPQELVGRDAVLFVHPDDRARIVENMQRHLEGMLPNTPSEYRGVCKNGEFRDITVLGARVSLNGSPAFIGNVVDITDRKQAQLELMESEKRLGDLIEQSPVVYELYDIDGLQMRVNAAWERLWAIPRGYGVGKYNILKSKKIADDGWLPYFERAFAGEAVTLPELEFDASQEPETRGESRRRWLTTLAYPIKDEAGQVRNVVVLHEDITDRRQSQEQLRRSQEKYSKLFQASPEAIVLTNPKEGRFIEVNDSFPKIFGYTRAETVGHTVFELGIWDDLQVRQHLLGLIEQKVPVRNVEVNFRAKDRRLIPCDFSCETVEINGERCLLAIVQDITERKRAERALRTSEETHRNVIQDAGVGIVVVLGDTIVFANRYALAVIGAKREQVVGSSFAALVHPDDLPGVLALHARLLAGETTPPVYQLRLRDRGRGEKWVQVNSVLYRWEEGKGTLSFLSDITEQRHAEQALRESEARFRTFVEQASEGIALVDEQGRVVAWNQAMEQISGIPPAQAVGRPVWDVQWQMTPVDRRSPPKADAFKWAFVQAFRTGQLPQAGKRVEVEVESANGERKVVEQTTFCIKTEIGYRFGSIVLDITERKCAEVEREQLLQQVQMAHEQLQALSRRLVQVQEEERLNIARELHDEVGQVLTGLKLMLDTSLRLPPETIAGRLQDAQALVGQLIDQVQELSLNLRPTMLDDYGLLPALTWHSERFKAQTGIEVAFEHHGLEQRLPPQVETAAYRIAQEALTNVARHAGVKHAALSLTVERGELCICVQDQGCGFDVKTVVAAGASTGLSSMRERASALGGRFKVEGGLGGGTRITAVLPLNRSLPPQVETR